MEKKMETGNDRSDHMDNCSNYSEESIELDLSFSSSCFEDDQDIQQEISDQLSIGPYRFEPDDSDVSESSNEDDTAADERRILSIDWCRCNRCSISQKVEECVCCQEVHRVTEFMEEMDGQPSSCITQHPGFEPVCLNTYVLQTAYHQYRQQYGGHITESNEWRRMLSTSGTIFKLLVIDEAHTVLQWEAISDFLQDFLHISKKKTNGLYLGTEIIGGIFKKGELFERYIIYCPSIKLCSDLYTMFRLELKDTLLDHIDMFHSKATDKVKEAVKEDMETPNGKIRILIATSAAGMGVNFQGVKNVINYGAPKDTFVQQFGRGGRAGGEAMALLLYSGKQCKNLDLDMKDYITNTKDCRRSIILHAYNAKPEEGRIKHLCCDICSAICNCGSEDCSKYIHPYSEYEGNSSNSDEGNFLSDSDLE